MHQVKSFQDFVSKSVRLVASTEMRKGYGESIPGFNWAPQTVFTLIGYDADALIVSPTTHTDFQLALPRNQVGVIYADNIAAEKRNVA